MQRAAGRRRGGATCAVRVEEGRALSWTQTRRDQAKSTFAGAAGVLTHRELSGCSHSDTKITCSRIIVAIFCDDDSEHNRPHKGGDMSHATAQAPPIDRRRSRAVRGDRARDAAGRARPDDPGHRAAGDRRATSAASPTSRGWSPPTSWPPRRRRRCGASSATATGASRCSRSRWRCSSPPPRSAAPRRTSPQLIVAARSCRAWPPAA